MGETSRPLGLRAQERMTCSNQTRGSRTNIRGLLEQMKG